VRRKERKLPFFFAFCRKAGGGIFTARPGAGRNRMPQKNAPDDRWSLIPVNFFLPDQQEDGDEGR
jgi:hypothetical protein